MRRLSILVLGLIVLAATGGCHLGSRRLARAPAHWIQEHGGLVAATDVAPRTRRAWQAVTRGTAPAGPRVRLRVLASSSLSAFAWPSGEIFLARGLVDLLDPDEIAAALAHEIAHLEAAGPASDAQGFAGLASRTGSLAAERRADLLGRELLLARNLPGHAMVGMLRKVHDHLLPGCAARAALEDRIRHLEAVKTVGVR